MNKVNKKLQIKKLIGIILIIIGLFGFVLPILPGWLFLLIGLEFIGINLVFFDRIKEYIKNKINK